MKESKYVYMYDIYTHKIVGFLELPFKNDIIKVLDNISYNVI